MKRQNNLAKGKTIGGKKQDNGKLSPNVSMRHKQPQLSTSTSTLNLN